MNNQAYGKADPSRELNKGRQLAAQLLRLIILLSGMAGLLLYAEGLWGVRFSFWQAFGAAAAVSIVLWIAHLTMDKGFPTFATSLLAVLLLLVYRNRSLITRQIGFLGRLITIQEYGQTLTVSTTVMFAAALFAMLLFVFEFRWEKHWVVYFVFTGILLTAPILGADVTALKLLPLLIFQIAFWAEKATGTGFGKRLLSEKRRLVLSAGSALVTAVLIALSFLVAVPLTNYLKDNMIEAAKELLENLEPQEGEENGPLPGDNQGGDSPVPTTAHREETEAETLPAEEENQDDGRINRGNLHQGEDVAMRVEVSQMPTEILYLKGYEGAAYDDSHFTAVDETAVFEELGGRLFIPAEEAAERFQIMYYRTNLLMNGTENQHQANVVREPGTAIRDWRMYLGDMHLSPGALSGGRQLYTGNYFEISEATNSWQESEDEEAVWWRYLEEGYEELALRPYTLYSAGETPRLYELVRAEHLTELSDITAYILYQLYTRATYTTTPGMAPDGVDMAEYFLFDNGKGYCQHYALTAVLMYRMYGVPARYATGYRVLQEMFHPQDGVYRAEVTGSSAHAWPEIFLSGYGWVPVEVTPGEGGQFVTRYPGFDVEDLDEIWAEHGWDVPVPTSAPEAGTENPESPTNEPTSEAGGTTPETTPPEAEPETTAPDRQNQPETTETSPSEEENSENSFSLEELWQRVLPYLILLGRILLVLLGIALVIFLIRKLAVWRHKRWLAMGVQARYAWMMGMLRFAGIVEEETGDEPEFAELLAGKLGGKDGKATASEPVYADLSEWESQGDSTVSADSSGSETNKNAGKAQKLSAGWIRTVQRLAQAELFGQYEPDEKEKDDARLLAEQTAAIAEKKVLKRKLPLFYVKYHMWLW